jgi:hypothetical protein
VAKDEVFIVVVVWICRLGDVQGCNMLCVVYCINEGLLREKFTNG